MESFFHIYCKICENFGEDVLNDIYLLAYEPIPMSYSHKVYWACEHENIYFIKHTYHVR